MKKKITLKSIFQVTWFMIFLILVVFFSNQYFGSMDFIGLAICLLPVVLSCFTLIEYFIIEKGRTIEIKNDKICFEIKSKQISLNFSEIESIVAHISPVMARNSVIRLLPNEFFYYLEIKKGEESFFITSLVESKIYDQLKSVASLKKKIQVKKSLFNSIYLNKLDKIEARSSKE